MPPRFHPFIRLVLCLIGTVAAIATLMVVMLLALGVSAHFSGKPLQGEIEAFFGNDSNKLIATVLTYPFILFCLIGCRMWLDRRSFASLGLRPRRAFPDFAFGAFCGALAITFLFGILWVSRLVVIEGPSPEAFEAGALASAGFLLLFAALFFCVGFMEEISFRGYALHNLNAWFGWRGAVATQAIVFAVIHPLNELQGDKSVGTVLWDARWALVNIFLIAVFFAQCYRKTGSLWFPIGFHAAWNFFLGCVWSLPVSGIQTFRLLDVVSSSDSALSGGSFGAEGSVFLTAIIAALIFVMSRVPDHPQATLDLALLKSKPVPVTPETPPPAELFEETEASDERGPSRFKTTMRPASLQPQLPPEFFRTESAAAVSPQGEAQASPAGKAQAQGDEPYRVDVGDDAFATRASQPPAENETATAAAAPQSYAPDAGATPASVEVPPAVAHDGVSLDSQEAKPAVGDDAVVAVDPPAPVEPTVPRPKREPRW